VNVSARSRQGSASAFRVYYGFWADFIVPRSLLFFVACRKVTEPLLLCAWREMSVQFYYKGYAAAARDGKNNLLSVGS
jgi:hypothetical protein